MKQKSLAPALIERLRRGDIREYILLTSGNSRQVSYFPDNFQEEVDPGYYGEWQDYLEADLACCENEDQDLILVVIRKNGSGAVCRIHWDATSRMEEIEKIA